MSGFKFDPSKPGLRKTLREWEELALRSMWDLREDGAKSKTVWERVNEELNEGKSISRASISLFLEKLEEQGVLGSRDTTGKGGHHKIYYPLMDEEGYLKYLLKTMVESMMRDFQEETKEALNEYL
jgi:predicted transcriptional regulator